MIKKSLLVILILIGLAGASFAQEEIFYQPVANISVSGNNSLSEQEILAMITPNVEVGRRTGLGYLQDDLESFFATGYFSRVSVNYFIDRAGLHIVYELQENPIIEKVAITGNISLSSEYILRMMKNQQQEVLNYLLLEQDIKKINRIYKEFGYELSQVSDVFFDKTNKILFVKIVEGRIGEIKIERVPDLRQELLTREIEVKSGDIFNTEKLRKERQKLLQTGLLGSVSSPRLGLSAVEDYVNIDFNVKGRKTNQVNFGYGLSSREYFGFVKLTLLNFFTWGETMSLRVQDGTELGRRKQTYNFRFYTPWIFNKKVSFAYERYVRQRYENLIEDGEIIDTLEIKRNGWGVDFGWLNVRPLYISTEYYEEDVSQIAADPTIGYSKKSIAQVFVYNSVGTDIYNNAASGEYAKLRLEGGGFVGDVFGYPVDLGGRTFGRYDLNYSKFLSLDLGNIIAVRNQTGIFNVDDPDKAILEGEQYAVGGSNTVRGYLDIYPFAVGSRKFIINLEYRHTFNSWLQGVVFYDWGSAFDLGPIYFNQFRSGKGVGVRFGTPLGPVRFDWAFGENYVDVFGNEHSNKFMPRNVLHFSLGQTF